MSKNQDMSISAQRNGALRAFPQEHLDRHRDGQSCFPVMRRIRIDGESGHAVEISAAESMWYEVSLVYREYLVRMLQIGRNKRSWLRERDAGRTEKFRLHQ